MMKIKSELFNKTKRYFSYKRSAGRVEYFACFAIAIFMQTLAKDSVTINSLNAFSLDSTGMLTLMFKFLNFPFVAIPFYLISIVLLVTVTIRRLRYLSLSLWWALLWVPMLIGLMTYWALMFFVLLLLISNDDEPIFSTTKNKGVSSKANVASSKSSISNPSENLASSVDINFGDILQSFKSAFSQIFLRLKNRKLYISALALLTWFFIINLSGAINIYYDNPYLEANIANLLGYTYTRGAIFNVPIIILAAVYGKELIGVLRHEIATIKNFKENALLTLLPLVVSTVIATLLVIFTYDYRFFFVWANYGYPSEFFYQPLYTIVIYFLSHFIMWITITFALPGQLRRFFSKRQDISISLE